MLNSKFQSPCLAGRQAKPNKVLFIIFGVWILGFGILFSCSSDNDIFPPAPTTTETASLELPNPISIAVDEANNQIIVVNSDTDYFYDQGSIAIISVDASDTTAPALSATSIIATPRFGGNITFDGTFATIPFRERPDEDVDRDQVIKYTIGSGSISSTVTGSTGPNPFGIAENRNTFLVVSDKELNIFDSDLNSTATVDLTTASEADISDASSKHVENIAVDTVNNRAFISNRGGKILVVDLDTNVPTHVINGPTNTRGIAFDGTFIYAVDGNPPALWVFNPSLLSDADSPPEEVDDSALLVEVIDLGRNPNGIAIDATNNRAYVANSNDRNISVIDLALLQEIDRISIKEDDTGLDEGKSPFGVAVGTFNGVLFVFTANLKSNSISVINANTLNVVAEFP